MRTGAVIATAWRLAALPLPERYIVSRCHELVGAVTEQLDAYAAQGDDGHDWSVAYDFRVRYPEIEAELCIGGIYVRLFLKEPTYDLKDPLGFLEQLMLRWIGDSEAQNPANAAEAATDGSAAIVASGSGDTLTAITSAIVYLLKVRAQLEGQVTQQQPRQRKPRGGMAIAREVLAREGVRGLWRGWATMFGMGICEVWPRCLQADFRVTGLHSYSLFSDGLP